MQYPLNIPAPGRLSSAIAAAGTFSIQTGGGAQALGYICAAAGTDFTIQLYNGNPSSGGTAVGPAITPTAGFVAFPPIGFPQGLYVVAAVASGGTAGSLQIVYH